eukprot:19353-Heterococcus_DN1.PRE.1
MKLRGDGNRSVVSDVRLTPVSFPSPSQLPVEASPDELLGNGRRKRAPRSGDVALADVLPEGFNLWGPDYFPKSDGSETGTQLEELFWGLPILQEVREAITVPNTHIRRLAIRLKKQAEDSNVPVPDSQAKLTRTKHATGDHMLRQYHNYLPNAAELTELQGTLTEKREQVITLICNDNTRGWHTKRSHEIEVMQHHTLNDFIQILPCPCIVAKPDSKGEDADPKYEDVTSYWCIDGTIYVKDPEEPCHLLVERAKAFVCAEVATGLRRLKKQGPPTDVADDEHATAVPMGNMMTTTFGSLELPVGSKSYYHHYGGCVHELTVLDSRFVSPTDAVLREKPVVSFVQSGVRRKCDVCLLKTAEYKCFNDKISDAEGTIYCRSCFHGLQYTFGGDLKNKQLSAYTFL